MKKVSKGTDREGFASRWSRRKLDPAPENDRSLTSEQSEVEEKEQSLEQQRQQRRAQALEQRNELTDEDMPDLAELDEQSDFSQFMSINVSGELRKLALRKLFQSEHYNIRDGLDEYDGDYTSFEKLDPTTITADMRHRIELEEARRKREQEQEQERLSSEGAEVEQAIDDLPDEPQLIENDEDLVAESEAHTDDEEVPDNENTSIEETRHE